MDISDDPYPVTPSSTGPVRARGRRGRRRLLVGGAVLAVLGAAAALAIVLLTSGGSSSTASTRSVPGQVIHDLGSGGAARDVSKSYPRIYSVKLDIDLAIKPGDGLKPPVQPIAFQYPGTAPLGGPGNTYLYAHDRPGMFLGLHNARLGDVLIVAVTPTSKLYYQITEIHSRVAWNDVAWLKPSKDDRLTLQTCNYSGDFDPRFIVVAKPIPAEQGRQLTGDA